MFRIFETDAPITTPEQSRLLGFLGAVSADQRSLLMAALEGRKPRISGDPLEEAPGHGYDRAKHNFAQQMTPHFADYRTTVVGALPSEPEAFQGLIGKLPDAVLKALYFEIKKAELPAVDLNSVRILGGLDVIPREAIIEYICQNRQLFITVVQGSDALEKGREAEYIPGSRLLAYHIYSAMQGIDHFPEIVEGPTPGTGPSDVGMVV